MSLQKNIFANYISQLYVTAAGILTLPLYVKYMGAEAYGLVGFFTMLQAWFALLDLGLTPTIARETARYHGGAMSQLQYRQLFRALSLIFCSIALIGGSALLLIAEEIASRWLKVTALPMREVITAIQIMAVCVSLRWMGGLYRGVLTGSERLVWLSAFNALIATLRFVAVFGTMWSYGYTPTVFFAHQLVVALLELIGLFLMSCRLLPTRSDVQSRIGWSIHPVEPYLKFALSIAFTSSVWVLVTQTDKLILSGILPLAEYAYFTLAVLAANGILIISGPISNAILPRLTRLHAEGKHENMIQVYRNATQLVTVIAGSATITIATFAEQLLAAWTSDMHLAAQAAPILRLYAIGNGFLTLAAFPYYLQYAKGNLRYHIYGNLVTLLILIPAIIVAATYYGSVGAGYVWAGLNGLFLLSWVAYVHHKLEPGLHHTWLIKDFFLICLPGLLIAQAASTFLPMGDIRVQNLLYIAGLGGTITILSATSSPAIRNMIAIKFILKN